jgi:hypothetical protein
MAKTILFRILKRNYLTKISNLVTLINNET